MLLLDNSVTLIIAIKKSVHENSPQKRNYRGQKCPREFTQTVYENLPCMPKRILPPNMY